ncbi:hypothetical protein B0H66DRAFT_115996 [Apodospora peruviana]|uniref:Uncharacterized protein n=1 Tax=Apodospora peruviana TaxID=516989 RepID=A0AAE0MAS2_9PEZI|nr:hypothetical protein B0H66DRAFT_115996 [Apodospora peruviana]
MAKKCRLETNPGDLHHFYGPFSCLVEPGLFSQKTRISSKANAGNDMVAGNHRRLSTRYDSTVNTIVNCCQRYNAHGAVNIQRKSKQFSSNETGSMGPGRHGLGEEKRTRDLLNFLFFFTVTHSQRFFSPHSNHVASVTGGGEIIQALANWSQTFIPKAPPRPLAACPALPATAIPGTQDAFSSGSPLKSSLAVGAPQIAVIIGQLPSRLRC